MMRCPIICIVQVWTYSSANEPASTSRNASAMRSRPSRSPAAMWSSMATFVSHGWASWRTEPAEIAARAVPTVRLCGRR